MAGARGPVPKRSDQRRRRNTPEGAEVTKIAVPPNANVDHPPADPLWHPRATELYESLSRSGQSHFYEPSDWAFARLLCDLLTRCMVADKVPALLVGSIMADLARLGVTEGDRRRMRIELERTEQPEEPASVTLMAKYRAAAGRK